MTILALDISLKTGYAHNRGGIHFGTKDFTEVEPDNAIRGRIFRSWLIGMIDDVSPDEIVIERPFLRNENTTFLLGGLVWEAHRTAELMGIPRREIPAVSIKKFITGNAKAKKPDVIASIKSKGFEVTDDNQADAVALLLLAMEGK